MTCDNISALMRWEERLSNRSELILPTDYPRPMPMRTVEAECERQITDETATAVIHLALALKVSPFSVFLSAFAVLLQKFTLEEDIVVGSSSASSNPLILRMKVSPQHSMKEVIQNVLNV